MTIYFFDAVHSRPRRPRVTSALSCLFHGLEEVPDRGFVEPDRATDPLSIYKNVFGMTGAFFANNNLVVERAFAATVAAHARTTTREIIVAHPYIFRFQADDLAYLHDLDFAAAERECGSDDADRLIRVLAKRRPEAWPFDYVELACHRRKAVPDPRRRRIAIRDDSGGLSERQVEISKEEVLEHGLLWYHGYWCTEAVFNILREPLRTPFISTVAVHEWR